MKPEIIIGIILGGGILGAAVNTLREKKKIKQESFWSNLVSGVVAAALVPLFLNSIASDLLKDTPAKGDFRAYFTFLGFCIIAAIYSREFISTVGEKILDKLSQVERDLEEVHTEEEDQELPKHPQSKDLNEQEKIVLNSFSTSAIYRSISGIRQSTGFTKSEVINALDELVRLSLVEVVQRTSGPRWKITALGRQKNSDLKHLL